MNIRTVGDYLRLPRSERYVYGMFYRRPLAMKLGEWERFDEHICKTHPLQYRLREFGGDMQDRFGRLCRWFPRACRWLFRPPHPLVRRAIPRHWMDLSSLIEDINFAIIRQFKIEMDEGIVDWTATEHHRDFKAWMERAIAYLDRERPALCEHLETVYERHGVDLTECLGGQMDDAAEAAFEEYCRLEKVIEESDTRLLQEMIERRGYFWT